MIIGISGKARSGKGEFANVAVRKYGAIELSFAATLKEEVAKFLDMEDICWEHRHLYGENHDKEATLMVSCRQWADTIENDMPELVDFLRYCKVENNITYFTPRSLMQWWGTEYRRAQDDLYWVKATISRCTDPNQLYVISDARFENEAKAIKEAGGKLVRVDRPNRPNISNENHPSEIGLDNWTKWDCMIINDGSVELYRNKCELYLGDLLK